MCVPTLVVPCFFGNVTGPSTITAIWNSKDAAAFFPFASGQIVAAIQTNRKVHVVGFSTGYTCQVVLGSSVDKPALYERGGGGYGRIDSMLVSGDYVHPCRVPLTSIGGIDLRVDTATTQIAAGSVPLTMLVEIELPEPKGPGKPC